MIRSAYGDILLRGRRGNPITDEILYFAYANGITAIQLAEDLKIRERWVRTRIDRGRERFEGKEKIPFIAWLEGLGLWNEYEKTKQADCPHKPIPIGTNTGCLRCLVTGLDATLALQALPVIPLDPTLPEPPKPKLTRKQKRSSLATKASSESSSSTSS